jgi:hypothetical protein
MVVSEWLKASASADTTTGLGRNFVFGASSATADMVNLVGDDNELCGGAANGTELRSNASADPMSNTPVTKPNLRRPFLDRITFRSAMMNIAKYRLAWEGKE